VDEWDTPAVVLGVLVEGVAVLFFFSSRRRHTRFSRDWSSDVCSSVLLRGIAASLREMDSPDLAAKWEDDARTVENHVRHAHQAQQWSDESARLNLRRRGERKNVVDRWQPAATALRRSWPHLRELTEAAYVITHEHAPFTTPDED